MPLLPRLREPLSDASWQAELELPPTVWLVDEPSCAAYDAFVRGHADGTLYHTLAWRDGLRSVAPGEPYYLAAMRGDTVVGVLPLFAEKSADGACHLVSLPDTPAGGLLTDDDEARPLLRERAVTLAQHVGASTVHTRRFRAWPQAAALCNGGWLRVPVAELLRSTRTSEARHTARFAGRATGEPHSRYVPLLPTRCVHSAGRTLNRIVTSLAAAGIHSAHLMARDRAGNVAGVAIWTIFGQRAYVLAYTPMRADRCAHNDVLAGIAHRAALSGARQMDLACPAHPDAHFQSLLNLNGVEHSIEDSFGTEGSPGE
ncbi:MAG: hypothetical protein KKB50_05220 [Planctomycetes bacterium]|nr:hypothetical protein [Planctomycetota bacterium]